MKGYREEIPKGVPPNPLRRLRGRGDSFEYGMAELTSQAYSQEATCSAPGWMRVTARDVNDPFDQLRQAHAAG